MKSATVGVHVPKSPAIIVFFAGIASNINKSEKEGGGLEEYICVKTKHN